MPATPFRRTRAFSIRRHEGCAYADEMGLLQMSCVGLLMVFGRAQELRNCSVETSPFTVDSTEAAATLATSLDCSNGDFDVEWVGEIFVAETIHVTNGTSLSITGGGSGGIADGSNATQLFVVDRGSTLRFSDMTFAHGNASFGGAISASEASVSFSGNVSFISNSAVDDGGAIFADSSSSIFWNGDGTQFISNSAGGSGGAIFGGDYSTITWYADDAQFISNSAGDDGGAIFGGINSRINWYGDDTRFVFNSADDGDGGAVYAWDVLYWNGDGTLFSSNSADYRGGAISSLYSSTVTWYGDGTRFISNSAGWDGGAINAGGSLSWDGDDTEFISNSAGKNGGAIAQADVFWNGNGTKFISNSAGVDGGAIAEADVSWGGDGILFSSNSAGNDGGAILVTHDVSVLWDGNTTFSRNVAGENGGAIAVVENDEMVIIYGGTFIENSARNGGALYFEFSTEFNISDAAFVSNSANIGGAVAAYTTGYLPATGFTRCDFSDNMSDAGGAVATLGANVVFKSCSFEGNLADVGGALRLDGATVIRGCSFLSNAAFTRGLAVAADAADGSTNISTSSFQGNELFCPAGSYRKDTEKEGPAARYETVCLDCPDWDECLDCSIARSGVTSTCEAPLKHTQAKESGVTLETLDVDGGYWRATNDSDNILACFNADACIGGQTGAEDFCTQGYTGPYCSMCEPDYSPSLSHTCTRCSSSRKHGFMAATVIAALVVACVVVAIVRYLVSTEPEEERSAGCFHRRIVRAIPLQALKIVVVVWQILIQFADTAQVTYPGVYQDFLSAIDVVNFDLGSALSAGCLWSNMDFHDRLLVSTLGPLVVVGLLGITYRVAMYRSSSAPGGDAVVEKIRYRHQTVLLLVTFLIYSSVSSTVFQTFACEKLDDGGDYLRADYNIQCTDAKHKNFAVYAGIMIFVYPVGIPLLYAILLFQRRDVLANADADKTAAQSIVGLWEPYRPERFYYEVVECGRRIMLTGVVVFIFPNDAAQIAITMLLAFFFFMVFEMLRPYEAESDMWLSRGGHMTVFLSMFYLLLLKVDVSGERGESQAVYGGVLVACHVLMVLAIVVEVVGICYTSRGNKQRDEETAWSSGRLPKLTAGAGSEEAPYFDSVPPP